MAALPKINLKAEVPEELKAATAQTKWGKVLSVTPVVMTVIATMLAGLSSSEMTRAQYDRSLAAQRQSKAGDQWNFFQGKKLRGVVQRSTLDMIGRTVDVRPLDAAALRAALGARSAAALDVAAGQQALTTLHDGALPKLPVAPALPATVQAALKALADSRPDAEIAALLNSIPSPTLDEALRSAEESSLAFDGMMKPIGQAVDTVEKQLSTSGDAALRRDFTMARLNYNALRYDAEAQINQSIASLFELQVRQSNISAERHHRRSERFFYGMLAAQMAVIISTLAMAAQKRNLLWSIAAVAGVVAIGFALYVFLYV